MHTLPCRICRNPYDSQGRCQCVRRPMSPQHQRNHRLCDLGCPFPISLEGYAYETIRDHYLEVHFDVLICLHPRCIIRTSKPFIFPSENARKEHVEIIHRFDQTMSGEDEDDATSDVQAPSTPPPAASFLPEKPCYFCYCYLPAQHCLAAHLLTHCAQLPNAQ